MEKKYIVILNIFLFTVLLPTYLLAYSFTDQTADSYIDAARQSATTELNYVDDNAYYLHDGTLLGVLTGNDSNQLSDIAEWLIDTRGYTPGFTLFEESKAEYDDDYATKYGEWSVSPAVSLYMVKAGDAFALYLLDPVQDSIIWNTYELWIRGYGGSAIEISHITGYNGSPVPEPATMMLFGIGLLGLARISRKKL